MKYRTEFYRKDNGKAPAEIFLNSLSEEEAAIVTGAVTKLEDEKGKLPMPLSRHINGKVWELRQRINKKLIRVFYYVTSKRVIVLLDGCVKKVARFPVAYIKKVESYQKDHARQEKK